VKKSSYVIAAITLVFLVFLAIGSQIFTSSLSAQKQALGKATEPLDRIDQEREDQSLTSEAEYWRKEDVRMAQEVFYQRTLSKQVSKNVN